MITQEAAISFVQKSVRSAGLESRSFTIGETFTAEDSTGMPTVHVINYVSGSHTGWMMVSGDTRIMPLLAYGFDEPMTPDVVAVAGVELAYKEYMSAVEGIRTGMIDQNLPPYDIEGAPQPCIVFSDGNSNCPPQPPPLRCHDPNDVPTDERIGPLLTTRWGQNCPYNSRLNLWRCNNDCDESRALAGCVPVAIAQVMNYWQSPAIFDYPGMLRRYFTTGASRAVAQQQGNVADLMRVSVDQSLATLGCNFTWTIPDNIHFAFGQLGYQNFGRKVDWNEQIVETELRAARPVIMNAKHKNHSTNWHVWIIDGMRIRTSDCANERWQTMNWGWNGRGDGDYFSGNWQPVDPNQPGNPNIGNSLGADKRIHIEINPN